MKAIKVKQKQSEKLIIIHSITDVFYTPKGRFHYFIEELAKK
jgi:cytochrome oxidase Cu insertion factor (SCO1/SenC/PrrC family)